MLPRFATTSCWKLFFSTPIRELKIPKSIAFYVFSAFVLAEIIIYIIYQTYDFAYGTNLIYLKYAGILTCLAFAAVGIYFYAKDGIVVTVALVFTAISDLSHE